MLRILFAITIFIPSIWFAHKNLGENNSYLWFSFYGLSISVLLLQNCFVNYSLNLKRICGLAILIISLIYLAIDHSGSLNSLIAFAGIFLGGYLSGTLSTDSDGF